MMPCKSSGAVHGAGAGRPRRVASCAAGRSDGACCIVGRACRCVCVHSVSVFSFMFVILWCVSQHMLRPPIIRPRPRQRKRKCMRKCMRKCLRKRKRRRQRQRVRLCRGLLRSPLRHRHLLQHRMAAAVAAVLCLGEAVVLEPGAVALGEVVAARAVAGQTGCGRRLEMADLTRTCLIPSSWMTITLFHLPCSPCGLRRRAARPQRLCRVLLLLLRARVRGLLRPRARRRARGRPYTLARLRLGLTRCERDAHAPPPLLVVIRAANRSVPT